MMMKLGYKKRFRNQLTKISIYVHKKNLFSLFVLYDSRSITRVKKKPNEVALTFYIPLCICWEIFLKFRM